jgi:hypothetical protein
MGAALVAHTESGGINMPGSRVGAGAADGGDVVAGITLVVIEGALPCSAVAGAACTEVGMLEVGMLVAGIAAASGAVASRRRARRG